VPRTDDRARDLLDPRAAGARRFVGKVAVVAGGGQGIGSATARRLAQEGATVVVADRVAATAERVRDELVAAGATADTFVGDLSNREVAVALMDAAVAAYGRIDVLVNVVGGTIKVKPFAEYSGLEVEAEVQRSFWPVLWCTWAAVPIMRSAGKGAIVNLGSHSVISTLRVPYAACKGAVIALTTSLSKELAPYGVRVNCVAPHGTTADDRVTPRDASDPMGPKSGLPTTSAEFAQQALAEIPMGRFARAEEQASAIAFLASDDASFITGQILPVGGGATWR
jgi:dihydroxycyclohexadiene carboxylate dehydrogenase